MKKKPATKIPQAVQRLIAELVEEQSELGGKTVLAILELKLVALEKQFQEQMKKIDDKYETCALNLTAHAAELGKAYTADFAGLEKQWKDFLESEKESKQDRKKYAEATQRHNAQIETGLKTLVELVKHLVEKK